MSKFNGHFVWHELMTTDLEAAKAFYSETIGWKSEPFEGSPTPYFIWKMNDVGIGGLMTLPDEAKKMGAPPHWLAHVVVDDVDAAAKKIEALGGKIYHTEEMPEIGKFCVFADPTGAVLSVYKPANPESLRTTAEKGEGRAIWNELWTEDPDRAWSFYSELFGWEKGESMEPFPGMTYQMYKNGDDVLGGYAKTMQSEQPSSWLYYFNVADYDRAVAQIKQRGGQVLNEMSPPNAKIAMCKDPQGAAFAIQADI